MLMQGNRAINSVQKHIESMMKVSSAYGKKMGTMGTTPFQSAGGSAFAKKTAEMMSERPEAMSSMLGRIMDRAKGAGMEPRHMERMEELAGRVRSQFPNAADRGGARTLRFSPEA